MSGIHDQKSTNSTLIKFVVTSVLISMLVTSAYVVFIKYGDYGDGPVDNLDETSSKTPEKNELDNKDLEAAMEAEARRLIAEINLARTKTMDHPTVLSNTIMSGVGIDKIDMSKIKELVDEIKCNEKQEEFKNEKQELGFDLPSQKIYCFIKAAEKVNEYVKARLGDIFENGDYLKYTFTINNQEMVIDIHDINIAINNLMASLNSKTDLIKAIEDFKGTNKSQNVTRRQLVLNKLFSILAGKTKLAYMDNLFTSFQLNFIDDLSISKDKKESEYYIMENNVKITFEKFILSLIKMYIYEYTFIPTKMENISNLLKYQDKVSDDNNSRIKFDSEPVGNNVKYKFFYLIPRTASVFESYYRTWNNNEPNYTNAIFEFLKYVMSEADELTDFYDNITITGNLDEFCDEVYKKINHSEKMLANPPKELLYFLISYLSISNKEVFDVLNFLPLRYETYKDREKFYKRLGVPAEFINAKVRMEITKAAEFGSEDVEKDQFLLNGFDTIINIIRHKVSYGKPTALESFKCIANGIKSLVNNGTLLNKIEFDNFVRLGTQVESGNMDDVRKCSMVYKSIVYWIYALSQTDINLSHSNASGNIKFEILSEEELFSKMSIGFKNSYMNIFEMIKNANGLYKHSDLFDEKTKCHNLNYTKVFENMFYFIFSEKPNVLSTYLKKEKDNKVIEWFYNYFYLKCAKKNEFRLNNLRIPFFYGFCSFKNDFETAISELKESSKEKDQTKNQRSERKTKEEKNKKRSRNNSGKKDNEQRKGSKSNNIKKVNLEMNIHNIMIIALCKLIGVTDQKDN